MAKILIKYHPHSDSILKHYSIKTLNSIFGILEVKKLLGPIGEIISNKLMVLFGS